MKKRVKILSIVIALVIVVGTSVSFPTTSVKAETRDIYDYEDNVDYSSPSSVPSKIFYKEGTYEGYLYLQTTVVSSGEASRTLNYYDEFTYSIYDYCKWDADNHLMNYQYSSSYPANSKGVTVDGYSFNAWLGSSPLGNYYTCYATPDMNSYRGTDGYPDDPWIGSSGVSDGQTYNTAVHYYKGWYSGSYTTPDTRKYRGVYSGTLINTLPTLSNNKVNISGAKYIDEYGNYWVKQNGSFNVIVTGSMAFDSSIYKINSTHLLMKDDNDQSAAMNSYIGNSESSSSRGGYAGSKFSINCSSVSTSRTSGTDIRAEYNVSINSNSQKIYLFPLLRIYQDGDYYNDSKIMRESQWWEYDKSVTVISDGDPPVSDSGTVDMPNINTLYTELINCNDYGSGVDNSSATVIVHNSANTVSNSYKLSRSSSYENFSATIDMSSGTFSSYYGPLIADFYVSDNVGNRKLQASANFTKVDPKPINDNFKMIKYDYKQDDYNYWMKVGNEFAVYNDGYLPDIAKEYPTRNYVLFDKDGLNSLSSSGRQYATTMGSSTWGDEYSTYFQMTENTYADEILKDGKKYLASTHYLKGLMDKTAFLMRHCTTYLFNGKEYYNGYKSSDMWIRFDGRPPTGNPAINFNSDTLNLGIDMYNVSDNGGSGIKKVWAEVYPPDDYYNKQTFDFHETAEKGHYKINSFNLYDMFNSKSIDTDYAVVDIWLEDNVGNQIKVKSEEYELFTVKAVVVPYNKPDYEPSEEEVPLTIPRGQTAILKIKTTGGAQELQLDFSELVDGSPSDTEQNIDMLKDITNFPNILLNSKSNEKAEYDFYIPLYCEEKKYDIKVKAIKYGRSREALAPFRVSNSAIDRLRTRIR